MARTYRMKLYIPCPCRPVEYKTMEIELYKGSYRYIKDDKLKSWTFYQLVSRPCGAYENGLVHIYKTRQKNVYAIVTYFDGSFYPLIAYTHLSAGVIKAIDDYKQFRKS